MATFSKSIARHFKLRKISNSTKECQESSADNRETSKVRKFSKTKKKKPIKSMFDLNYLKKMNNSLEQIAISKYPKLKSIKLYLERSSNSVFVRMTGSGDQPCGDTRGHARLRRQVWKMLAAERLAKSHQSSLSNGRTNAPRL